MKQTCYHNVLNLGTSVLFFFSYDDRIKKADISSNVSVFVVYIVLFWQFYAA